VRGKGDKTVLVPLPPAVSRAIETARDCRDTGPTLRSRRDTRMDRHCAIGDGQSARRCRENRTALPNT